MCILRIVLGIYKSGYLSVSMSVNVLFAGPAGYLMIYLTNNGALCRLRKSVSKEMFTFLTGLPEAVLRLSS
jgi:hypothetical protein